MDGWKLEQITITKRFTSYHRASGINQHVGLYLGNEMVSTVFDRGNMILANTLIVPNVVKESQSIQPVQEGYHRSFGANKKVRK